MLGRCRIGTAGPASYPTGCLALAHPAMGVVLLDVAPDATPNAEARLRRALDAAGFWSSFPGTLPVWHGRIDLGDWHDLSGIIAEGLADLPPLTLSGAGVWVAAARAALAEDLAWEVAGGPRRRRSAMPEHGPGEGMMGLPRVRPAASRSRLGLGLGVAAIFGAGLASGLMLASDDAPPSTAPPLAARDMAALRVSPTPPTPTREALPAREEMASVPALESPPVPAWEPSPPAALPVTEPEPAPPAAPPPFLPLRAVALQAMAPLPSAEPRPVPALETDMDSAPQAMTSPDLPLPPVVPRPPVQKAAAHPSEPRIDRACALAQLRFQQGYTPTAAEAAYLRGGCVTRR
ncbi:hypothetical protein [Roseicella aquatilis]|uniref:Uncharacterized protein n=1 Tax=Roseicella aquatilis TaxID=2527868 RepID=A0A4R4DQN3_9PROT|nr:hypothetical protein [Roseicella aquatilis]TCZ64434.1 hypothetical protein EXY23_07245 [Roseicella aquatilis]